jgi:hypothetical protein
LTDATSNADTVERWWRMWPQANVAIATGTRSGLVVLDVDPRHCGDVSLAALVDAHGSLPETPCVWTGGGGLHYYFGHPGVKVSNSAGKVASGIDIRGDGGYVVAPPSLHVSGRAYEWAVACEPAPLPTWLLPTHSPAADRVEFRGSADVLQGVPEGERDDQLFRLAAKLRGADVPEAVAADLVLKAAAECRPPFPTDAALRKVASAYGRYSPTPRAAEPHRRRGLVNLR